MFSAVIDNTALVDLTHLHSKTSFLQRLRNIFHTVYVPIAVKNEYEKGLIHDPNRSWLLDRLNPTQGFFRLCTSYDTFIMVLLDKYEGIHKGESESYAQFKKIGAQIIISDDKRFTKAIGKLDPGIKVYTTVHLLCWLDILNYLQPDWNAVIRQIHQARPFSSRTLREAYQEMLAKSGIKLPKKIISEKCSLKGILQP